MMPGWRTHPRVCSTEVLAGLVERVTFHNADNGFCVPRVKARGQRDLITVLGHAAIISAGEFVQASGAWVNDRILESRLADTVQSFSASLSYSIAPVSFPVCVFGGNQVSASAAARQSELGRTADRSE